jgi:hypothetical protein
MTFWVVFPFPKTFRHGRIRPIRNLEDMDGAGSRYPFETLVLVLVQYDTTVLRTTVSEFFYTMYM